MLQAKHIIAVIFALSFSGLSAQVYLGPNLGPAYGRTVEAGLQVYIPNEDWISILASGGYTFEGPLYFPRKKKDCISDVYNQGWHMRIGARNGLTVDHHKSHMFWGLDLTYSHHEESALLNSCATATEPTDRQEQAYKVWSGGLALGYTWNPVFGRTIYQKFLLDFGLRISHPFYTSQEPFGERNYFSGIGFTWLPIRNVALEPIVAIRWELFHDKYGHNRMRTVKRYK